MKTHLLALCILLGSFLSITFAYGDDIPAHGKWDDERYRSIHVLPPTLSIEPICYSPFTFICEKTCPIGSLIRRSALRSLGVGALLITTRHSPLK